MPVTQEEIFQLERAEHNYFNVYFSGQHEFTASPHHQAFCSNCALGLNKSNEWRNLYRKMFPTKTSLRKASETNRYCYIQHQSNEQLIKRFSDSMRFQRFTSWRLDLAEMAVNAQISAKVQIEM